MKSPLGSPRTFRANPIEALIFLGMIGLFTHSGYRLIYDWDSARAWTRLAATESLQYSAPGAAGRVRAPASTDSRRESAKSFMALNVSCVEDAPVEVETRDSHVRVNGTFCRPSPSSKEIPLRTEILFGTSKERVVARDPSASAVAVMTYSETQTFSSELISVDSEQPKYIRINFYYRSKNEPVSRWFTVRSSHHN